MDVRVTRYTNYTSGGGYGAVALEDTFHDIPLDDDDDDAEATGATSEESSMMDRLRGFFRYLMSFVSPCVTSP